MARSKAAFKVIEIVWGIIAVMALIAMIHAYIRGGFYKDTYIFFIICATSVMMYFFRRNQRKQKKQE